MIDEYTGKTIVSPLDFSEILFELQTKDGHKYKLRLNGQTEGFPEGTTIVNRAYPLFCRQLALPVRKKNSQSICVSGKQTDSIG